MSVVMVLIIMSPLVHACDIGALLVDYGPIVAVIILLIVIVMYLLAYITRYFHYLKMKEFVYLDDKTLDFGRNVVQLIIIGLTVLGIIYLASIPSVEVRYAFDAIMKHMPSVFFVAIVIIVAIIIARLLHSFGEYLRGHLKKKPKKVAPPGTLRYAELILKYSIYIVAAVIALIGGLALLPEEENFLRELIERLFSDIDTQLIMSVATSLVLLAVVTFIISKFMDIFYEDLRRHTTKYSVRVNDILKGMSKDVLYVVALFIGVLFVLARFLSYTELLLTIGIIVLIVVFAVFLTSELIKNSLSGLSLMIADPFSEGDRIRILDGMVCDVVQMNLTYTTVRTVKGEIVSVPNTELIKHEIVDLSRSERFALSIRIGVDHKVPHQKVEELLFRAAEKTTGIVNEPKPSIFGEEFKDSTIMYELLTYTNSPKELKKVRSELIYNIQEAFQAENLTLSMPSQ